MKEYVLLDSYWELKRYLAPFEKRWIVNVEPDESSKLSKLKELLFSYNLLEKPLVLVKWIEKWSKEDLKWLKEALKKSEADVIIVSSQSEILKGFGKFKNLLPPKPWEESKWIKKIEEISNCYSMTLKNTVIRELLKRVGPNVELLSKEIEKLSVVSSVPSLEDVKNLVPLYTTPSLFEFVYLTLIRDKRALEMLKEILKDTHPLSVVKNLENQCIVLAQLLSMEKREYSWNEIQHVATFLKAKTPQIADLVGFPLGNRRKENILKLVNFEEIIGFLELVQEAEINIKDGEEPTFLLLNLVKNWIEEGGIFNG